MVVSAGLGAPLALLGCVVIPLLPCLLLLHQRGHLGSPDVKRQLAFLYCSYRSVPANPHLLCAVQDMSLAACTKISSCPLRGIVCQDSCWKSGYIVIHMCECGAQHGCINCVAAIIFA